MALETYSVTTTKDLDIFNDQFATLPLALYAEFVQDDAVIFDLGNNKKIICQMKCNIQEIDDFKASLYEIFIIPTVISGISSLSELILSSRMHMTRQQMSSVKTDKIKSVKLELVMKKTKDILRFRKTIQQSSYCILNIMKTFIITNNCIIDLRNKPMFDNLGVTHIIVNTLVKRDGKVKKLDEEKVNLSEMANINFVGKADDETYIDIIRIETRSEKSKGSPIAGLDDNVIERILKRVRKGGDLLRRKGSLLIGPPGCGKTSLVEYICQETNATLMSSSAVDLTKNGDFTRMNKFIDKASGLAKYGPCVVFVDDIDKIFSADQPRNSFMFIQCIKRCLQVCDLFVIAATNKDYAIPQKVRQAGIFEEIVINVPNESQRKDILKLYASSFLDKGNPIIDLFAKSTPAFVGLDLRYLCEKLDKLHQEESAKNTGNFEKKALKIISQTKPNILDSVESATMNLELKPIRGLEEIEALIRRKLIRPFAHPTVYKQLKIKPIKGLLLYGPRGCGKTSLIAKLANENSFNFLSVKSTQILSPYVGESEKNIAKLFRIARQVQPTILFIDEIDGLFKSRSDTRSSVAVSMLTELLQEIDGAGVRTTSHCPSSSDTDQQQDRVVLIGATNHPSHLDDALLRPGRFDVHIYVPPPNREARLQILKTLCEGVRLEDPTILDEVARSTDGWSPAELEGVFTQLKVENFMDSDDITSADIVSAFGEKRTISQEEIKEFLDFESRRYRQ